MRTTAYRGIDNVSLAEVLDQVTFINYGFTLCLSFFGCNDLVIVPILLYIVICGRYHLVDIYLESFLQSKYNRLQLETNFNDSFDFCSFGNNRVDKDPGGCLLRVTLPSV